MVKTEKDSKGGIGSTKWIQMTINDYVPVWYSSDTKNIFRVSQIGDAMFHIDVSKHQAYSAEQNFMCFHVWSMMWMSTFVYVYSGWHEHIVSFWNCHWSLSLVIVHSEDFWILDLFFNLLHFEIQHIQISQKGVDFSSNQSQSHLTNLIFVFFHVGKTMS